MNIVITGAGKGLGLEITKHFFEEKGHTILAVSRHIEQLSQLKTDLNMIGHSELQPIAFDLENILKTDSGLTARIVSQLKHIDILINNAGLLIKKDFEQFTDDEIFKIFSVNFFSASRLTAGLIPFMGKTNRSHVINISSMGGFQGSAKFKGLSIYSASKAALAVLTECLAEEYKDKNISFNSLALGSVKTEMFAAAFPGYKAQVSAKEMAAFIAGFAANGNKYFNGKIIPVSLSTP